MIVDDVSTWVRVRGGPDHVCAVDDTDAIWFWGDNRDGRLSIGRNDPLIPRPEPVLSAPAGVTALSGYTGLCALAGGDPWCWGETLAYQYVPTPAEVILR